VRGVLTQVRAAVLRRPAQTATVLLISLLAGTVATLALTLLVRSTAPFEEIHARVQGPDLVFHLDAARVTLAQLEATESLPGVTAAGPPRLSAMMPFELGDQKFVQEVIDRDSPGGSLDRLLLVSGRWPERPGEIAIRHTGNSGGPFRAHVGDRLKALTSKTPPEFTVVGEVADVGDSFFENNVPFSRAWVLPGQVEALAGGSEIHLGYEMAYRFRHAATADEIAADRQEVQAALPVGAELSPAHDWLSIKRNAIWLIDMMSSLILAFTVLALLAVTLIVASVVSGVVVSSYREIGIAKALGFTPASVTLIFVGQMALPAMAGALLGVPIGAAGSRPLLNDVAQEAALPELSVFDPVVDLAVPAAVVALVVLAALLPALRAAATDSVRAISLGAAPRAAHRSRVGALLARARAPRPFSLGAGDAFARPMRALLTLAALAIGIATVTFAIAFPPTVKEIVDNRSAFDQAQDVTVYRYPGLADEVLTKRLDEQPGTQLVVSMLLLRVSVPGLRDPEPIFAMRGNAQALGYRPGGGRWFSRPGEALIGPLLARDIHVGLGDSVVVMVNGRPVALKVVGFLNDFTLSGRGFRVGWDSVEAELANIMPNEYLVRLRPGTDAKTYARAIEAAWPDFVKATAFDPQQYDVYVSAVDGLVGGLALVLVLVAAAGVFNAALLSTRERIHDIATLKAVGMTPAQIGVMAVASIAVLAVVAAIVGIPGGVGLSHAIWLAIFGAYGVTIDLSGAFAPLPLALAVVAAFAAALAGAAFPARWAAATPVAEVLRSE
jgi:putative ABC transport system permease protein